MKTLKQHQAIKSISFIGLILLAFVTINSAYAQNKLLASTEVSQQTKTIKGIIRNADGPLPGVDISLKGTRIGVVTDKNGAFTFPRPLKANDVLVFSYLGYKTKEVKIDNSMQLIKLTLDEVSIEMIGALDSGKPYKSKRKN